MRPGKKALLCMPGYGNMSARAGRAFWRATRTPDQVWNEYNESSLLGGNFCSLWVTGLNLLHAGQQVDYFAMQHSDVGADDWWLDKLIDELEAHDLDVLSVIVPIKDTNGLTSLALERPRDPWHPLCRLTMSEIYRLPETFTAEDVGHPLLLNTGLWVCRFDPRWVFKDIHFTINDRIVFNTARDRFMAETEPEDWHFSRQCNRLGLKIGATRKIHVLHRGDMEFSNAFSWGSMKFDRQWIDHSVIPEDGFQFPQDVDGWLTETEGRQLAKLSRGKHVLEIGSYCGRSTICIAQTAESVVCIDPHDGRETPKPRQTFVEFLENLRRYEVLEKVKSFKDFECYQEWTVEPEKFRLAFIDGAHDYDSVQHDIQYALSELAPGGLIAFHDYHTDDIGVMQAVDEFVASGAEIISTHDSLAVVRPPALVPMEV